MKQLIRPMDHIAVLTHKPPGSSLTDKMSNEDRNSDKSQQANQTLLITALRCKLLALPPASKPNAAMQKV